MASDDGAVRVGIRVRPFIHLERGLGAGGGDPDTVVSYPSKNQIQLAGAHSFTYDYLYTEQSTQAEVYSTCVAPLVSQFVEGYNATILAYGQTGSGKTHTMGTASAPGMNKDDYGIIPRVLHELYEIMKARERTHTYLLKISFIEIYNDEIIDLLCTIPRGRPDRPVPHIKEGGHNNIEVENVVKQEVKSYMETLQALERGSLNRATGSTNMNATSSRSHAIFTLQLSQKVRDSDESDEGVEGGEGDKDGAPSAGEAGLLSMGNDEFITSKFHFVDLAGSERIKRTGAVGERLKEGIAINSGLLALGNVISALGDPSRKGGHVPFRDSKITRLLQDSLGGNSKTLMLATVSPADTNREETLNTLQYANRARNIKNKPIINRDPMSQKLDLLRGRIKQLEAELAVWRSGQIPTAQQKAAFANLTLAPGSLPSLSAPHIASALPPGGLGGGLAENEIGVDVNDWMATKDQLAHLEQEVRRLNERNKVLRMENSSRNQDQMRAFNRADQMRLKIEMLAERFPEVKAFLIAEKEEVEKERREKEKGEREKEGEEQKQKDEEESVEDAPAAMPAPISVPASSPSASSEAAAFPSFAPSPSASPSLDVDTENENGPTFHTSNANTPRGGASPVNVPAGSASSSSSSAPAPSPSPTSADHPSLASIEAALESIDASEVELDTFFTLRAPGGTESVYNADLTLLSEKNLLLSKLVRKFKSQKESLMMGAAQINAFKKKLAATTKAYKRMKRRQMHGEDGEHDEEGDEHGAEDDDDDLVSDVDSSSKRTSVGVDGTPLTSPMSDLLNASDLSDLDSSDVSEDEHEGGREEEEDMDSLQTLVALKEQEHASKLRHLTDQESGASKEISEKEAFLQQLTIEKQRAMHQRQMYERTIAELENEHESQSKRIVELEQLATNPTPASKTASNPHGGLSEAQSAELKQLKDKLKQLNTQLKSFRDKVKQLDQLKKQHAADEQKIKQLTAEIERAKKVKVEAARKIEESQAKHREWVEHQNNKMKLLQKDQRKNELALRNLKIEMSQQALQLKRAREANTVLTRKVREQDSSVSNRNKAAVAAIAAAKARANKLPTKYNANSLENKRNGRGGAAGGAPKSRKPGLPPSGSHSRSRSQLGVDASSLLTRSVLASSETARRALAMEFDSFLADEKLYAVLKARLSSLQHRLASYEYARTVADAKCNTGMAELDALQASGDIDAATADQRIELLIQDVDAADLGCRVTQKEISQVEAEMRAMEQRMWSGGWEEKLEERLAARFKNELRDEPPKLVLAALCRAILDEHVKKSQRTDNEHAQEGAAEEQGDSQDKDMLSSARASKAQLQAIVGVVSPNSATSSSSLTSSAPPLSINTTLQYRRSSVTEGAGVSGGAPVSLLSTSPIHRAISAGHRPSPSLQLLSPPRAASARSTSGSSHSAHSSVDMSGGAQAYKSLISLSPVQTHLSQAQGVNQNAQLPPDEDGEEGMEYLVLPRQDEARGRLFMQGGDEADATSPTSGRGYEGEAGADKKSLSSSIGRNSTGSKASSSSKVFDRLTDPQHFTGVYKARFDGQVMGSASAHSREQRDRASGNRPASAATGAAAGGGRKSHLLSVSNATRLSSERSPSPMAESESAPPTASSSRVPIHERLYDPKSYTGAQKQRFAEGVKSVRSGKEAGMTGATSPASAALKDREDGFQLGPSRPSTGAPNIGSHRGSIDRGQGTDSLTSSASSAASDDKENETTTGEEEEEAEPGRMGEQEEDASHPASQTQAFTTVFSSE